MQTDLYTVNILNCMVIIWSVLKFVELVVRDCLIVDSGDWVLEIVDCREFFKKLTQTIQVILMGMVEAMLF